MKTAFDISNLLHENFDTSNLNQDVYIEETHLFATLKFISESKSEFRECSKELYKYISESNDVEAINESFGDFFDKVKDIIDKFIKFVKTMIAKFLTGLNGMFKSEKYLNNHLDDLKKFGSDHEFDMDVYEFTHLDDPDIPKNVALTSFQEQYDDINKKIQDLKEKDQSDMIDAISAIYTQFTNELQNSWYDEFRARVIGSDSPISSSDYASELFSLFRNDSSDKESKTIDGNEVSETIIRYKGYNDIKKSVQKNQTQIEKDYEAIKKQVGSMLYRNKDNRLDLVFGEDKNSTGITVSNDVMNKINLFVKSKADQISQMSSIHAIALSAKLDAINDSFKQDKTVLYKALYKVQGTVVQSK